jgi:hypothetical protein
MEDFDGTIEDLYLYLLNQKNEKSNLWYVKFSASWWYLL